MKRCIKILMTLLSFCLLASLFAACTKQQDSVVKHSIYFVDGTHTIDTIETTGFEILDLPQAEKIDGFTFEGWFFDKDTWNEQLTPDFYENQALTKDITVYAKRSADTEPEKKYTVSFAPNGGSDVASVSVSVIESAPATTRDHYHFDGWYSSASLEEASKISFPYTPTANVTLYAKWTQTEFYVTYETNEGSSVSGGWVETIDSEPFTTRSGYDFTGWYTNEDLSADSLVEFPFTPTKNTVLYAGWKKAVDPKLLSIDGFIIEGTTATKTSPLGGDTAEFDFEQQNVTVSETAQWAIYKDADCTQVYQDNIVPIELGENIFYLKVSAGEKSCV